MAGESLADVIEVLDFKKNKDLSVDVRLMDVDGMAYENVVVPMLSQQKKLLDRLVLINNSLIRLEKNTVRIINLLANRDKNLEIQRGIQKLKDAEEPEITPKPNIKVEKKPEEKGGLDFLDLLAAGGITIFALKSRIFQALGEMVQSSIDAFVTWVKGFRPLILKIFDTDYAKAARNAAGKVGGIIRPFFERLTKYINLLGSKLVDAARLIPGVGRIAEWAARFLGVVKFLAWPITIGFSMWNAIKESQADMEALNDSASLMERIVTGISGGLKGIAKFIVGGVLDLVKGATSWVVKHFAGEGNKVSEFLDSFSFEDMIGTVFDSIRNLVISTINGIVDIFKTYKSGNITGGITKTIDLLLNNALRILQPLVKLLVGIVNRIPLVSIPDSLKSSIRKFGVDPDTGMDTGMFAPEVVGGKGGQKILEQDERNERKLKPVVSSKVPTAAGQVDYNVTPAAYTVSQQPEFQRLTEYNNLKREYITLISKGAPEEDIKKAGEIQVRVARELARDGLIPVSELQMVERSVTKVNATREKSKLVEVKTGGTVLVKSENNSREQLNKELHSSINEKKIMSMEGSKPGSSLMVSSPTSNNIVNNTSANMGALPFTASDNMDPSGINYQSSFSGR